MFQLIPSVFNLNLGVNVVIDSNEKMYRTVEILRALNNGAPQDQRIKTTLYLLNSPFWLEAAKYFHIHHRALDIRTCFQLNSHSRDLLSEESPLVVIESTTPSYEKMEEFIEWMRELRIKALTNNQCIVLSIRRAWSKSLLEYADKVFTVGDGDYWTVVKSRDRVEDTLSNLTKE